MKGRTINTADLHDVVMQRKKEYGKLADLIDSTVEEMVAATPTSDRTVQDFVDKCRECGANYGKQLKQLRERTSWIPCSERLPSRDEYIKNNGLFIVSDGNRTYAEWFDIYGKQRFGKPTMAGFRVDRAVAAWMPLPDSYNLPVISTGSKKVTEIHCNLTGAEIAQSFIDDVMAVEDLLPRGETESEE